ncbi:hydroxymethylglutaryl-CoA lyase [Bosea thiooxidans]|nr:hydroxymethylglutaryl-CoA lyase [Bosea sp. (in: a-proteobacteria)]
MASVEIVEVAPRDGLQNIAAFVPTESKLKLIHKLVDAGVKRMEIGSFVSPKAIPQMADMDELVTRLGPLPGLHKVALVPNGKGARRAMEAGIHELIFVISMSNAHNMSNVRRPTAASIADLEATLAEVDPDGKLIVRVGLATTFHCPFEGTMDEDSVFKTIGEVAAIRGDIELTLADTTGMALPNHVGRMAERALSSYPQMRWAFHGHDTAGFGIANTLAAYQAGIRSFDGAAGGLGGCPFAPGATGNIATEDMVYMFERMGVDTGIDLAKLLDAAKLAVSFAPDTNGSHTLAMPRDRAMAGNGPAAACVT